jgi:tripartite-type tricarboxylate transporter receptor subunit TctC
MSQIQTQPTLATQCAFDTPSRAPWPLIKRFSAALGVGLSLAAASFTAQAQSFPTKPIRWVVVAPAGSSLDVIARAMQDRLKDNLGQAVVVENKPQAGGTVGTNEVAKSAPDGYTWVMSYNGPLSFAPYLYPKLPYQPLKDLQAVMITTSAPSMSL